MKYRHQLALRAGRELGEIEDVLTGGTHPMSGMRWGTKFSSLVYREKSMGTKEASETHPLKNNDGMLVIDTTSGSLIHRLAGYPQLRRSGLPPSMVRAFFFAAAITYLPLLIWAFLSPLPVARATQTLRLPFLLDWNFAFMYLVSFPSLVALTVNDQRLLNGALQRVQMDGIVSLSDEDAAALVARWKKMFRKINIGAQILGASIGALVTAFNCIAYTPSSVGLWIADKGKMLPIGYGFLYCIFLFFSLIPYYAARSIALSVFLQDLVTHAQIRMLPFHPDRCAGLRPVGRLGLRNQYILTVFGLNLVILAAVSLINLGTSSAIYDLMAAAVVAYLCLGPLVFMGPLLPFRAGMVRTKAELMSEVAQRLRIELQRMRSQLMSGIITKEDEELIDRLRKIGALIDELPVWPFDAGTLRKFLAAYVAPIASAGAFPLLRFVLGAIVKTNHP